jgi:butyryl-CoA dehydrogenase
MDLLGRKVLMENGKGLQLLTSRMQATIQRAKAMTANATLSAHADALGQALNDVGTATKQAWSTGQPADALANAVPYMQAFGHTVLAWIHLDVACAALRADASATQPATQGRLAAAQFFFHYELPKIGAWLFVVQSRDKTCADLPEAAF